METKAVLDDRLDCPDRVTMVTSLGPESTTYIRQPASNMTSTQPVFSIQLPSYATGCSRRVMWNLKGEVTIRGTGLDHLLPAPQSGDGAHRIAFRQFPLQSTLSSIQVQLNDTLLSLPDPSKFLHALLRKGVTSKTLAGPLSMVNAVPDTVNDYVYEYGAKHKKGTSIFNEPFLQGYSNYATSSRRIGMGPMGTNAIFTELTFEVDIHEPLVCPPFEYSPDSNTKSIFGVNTIQVTCNMAHIHRMLSIAVDPNLTSIDSVTLVPTEQHLSINYVTPPPSLIREGQFIYGYTNVQAYSFPCGNAAAGVDIKGSSGVVDLPVIPKGFIVFVTPNDNVRNDPTISIPDLMFPINAIQVSFHTKSGLLSSADQIELYNNNIRNGVEYPYAAAVGLEQFVQQGSVPVYGSGNILYIDTAADLSLPEDMMPGMSMKTQFAVTSFSATNNSGDNQDQPEIHILALTDGVISNDRGSSSQQLGGVSPQTVSDCSSVLRSDVERLQREGGFGGKFSLGKALKKLSSTAQTAARGAQSAYALGQQYAPDLTDRAMGMARDQAMGVRDRAVGMARRRLGFGGTPIGGYAGCPPKRSLRDYM